MATPPARTDAKYQKFAVAATRLPAPEVEVRPPSPVRRSGSPLRRKQIHDLENVPEKRQKTTRFTSDAQSVVEPSNLDHMTESIDRIANTFASTATTLRDSKVFQQTILDEIKELKTAMAQLQKDVSELVQQSRKEPIREDKHVEIDVISDTNRPID